MTAHATKITADGTAYSAATRTPRRSSTASATDATTMTETPANISDAMQQRTPATSARHGPPSRSASTRAVSPTARAPVKPIWNAKMMLNEPGPKKTNAVAAAVAIHGSTLPRRMITRSSAAAARWAATTGMTYGR